MAVESNAERLILDFKSVPRELRRELRPTLRKSAQPILRDVKDAASWSTRIPEATRISTRFAGKHPGVSIVVNAKKAPEARPLEHMGQLGFFRHPVYGNREVWVDQRARPFLFRTSASHINDVRRDLEVEIQKIALRHGWKVSPL